MSVQLVPVLRSTHTFHQKQRHTTIESMDIKRTWCCWWCILQISCQSSVVVTSVLALQYPNKRMRHQPQPTLLVYRRTIVPALDLPKRQPHTQQRTFDNSYPDFSNHRRRIGLNFFSPTSQQRQWASSSLGMSTDDANIQINVDNDTLDSTTATTMTQDWEALYQGGRSGGIVTSSSNNKIDNNIDTWVSEKSAVPAYEIRVVSFDLDNTLWNTSATIDAANNALAQHMNEQLLHMFQVTTRNEIRVEKVMGTLFTADKTKYSPLEGENAKSPVLLTKLRKDAINQVVGEYIQQTGAITNQTTTDISTITDAFVDNAFDVWMKARHDSISQQLVSSTMSVMECIQQLLAPETTNNPNARILIGAITDGNSNPKLIPQLANVFDFYMNAEMVGIGKPNKRIYLQAAKDVFTKYPTLFKDLIPEVTMINSNEMSDDQIEEMVGPWWIHIGDDFVKDIVASNSLKMRNIWTRELCNTKTADVAKGGQPQPSQQRTVDELMQVVNEKKVVEMSIGADAYLADAVTNEFATAVVDELKDVVRVLQKWQLDAMASSTSGQRTCIDDEDTIPVPQFETETVGSSETNSYPTDVNSNDKKFCMTCGTKLPTVAKFCSACGAAQ